ncbi:MAG: chromosome segregation protein SMC [Gemmatimonadota bacterium]|nr:chromosome segregation protein SMC [Gemmatimonadota bacterium]
MKLKSLHLHGFKSFPDQTRIRFHDGITAIVGPNGCGKSNIGDAIRWVLGEQRPTAIRGARMEEVIFQGTVSRGALNRGAVSMVVSNDDGALPVPFEEVEIGRTVFRDGGSDYRLNRSSCRLRDIVDLCRDTGLGANAYSIIEIRMIDAILSERTDERRSLFEEAAGIGKYKDRRRAALRRLETSEADLQRLEDVIAEVRSKVRSLARQKGKAQRYRDLRRRRLDVEVAVARLDMTELDARLVRIESDLATGREEAAGMAAGLGAAEAALERARVEHLEAERARVAAAGHLDEVVTELARVEKEVAVAEERIAGGDRRLAQISEEETSLVAIRARSEDEVVTLNQERQECHSGLTECKAELTSRVAAAAAARQRMEGAHEEVRGLEERASGTAREIARAEGDRDSAGLQVRELGHRFDRLSAESREGAGALRELRSQGDLFSDRRDQASRRAGEAERAVRRARRRVALVRERLSAADEAERETHGRVAALEAEFAALGRVDGSREGMASVATAAREALPECVRGMLTDYIRVSGVAPRLVDGVLGRFGLALVVGGMDDASRVSRWYRSEPGREAGLVLLPMDAAPEPRGPLPDGVTAFGQGRPWAEAFLGAVRLGSEGSNVPPDDTDAGEAENAAAPHGAWTDALGALHLVPERGAEGRLERRSRLEALETALTSARRELVEARETRLLLDREHDDCEKEADTTSERFLATRDEARAAEAGAVAQTDRRTRLTRHQEEISRQLEGTKAARDRAVERGRTAAGELDRLRGEEAVLSGRLDRLRSVHAAAQAEWEQARTAESEMAVRAARLESEHARLAGRISDTETAVARAAARIAELGRESDTLGREMAAARDTRSHGRESLQTLFGQRDRVRDVLAEHDRALRAASEAVAAAERRAREVRDRERAAIGREHQLEMERQDIRNRAARIAERLETEWGRSLEILVDEAKPAEGDPEELRAELADIVTKLGRIGAVNMLAVEEHAEESERLEFLVRQQEDLVTARNDLRAAIRRINATATELFMTSFEAIRENFQRTFEHLFSGGEANLWLSDPESPLESRVEIHAAPRGKRTQRIDLLSGGERALTALSLLFGIYLVKPSPFCVLDEVDAPLDESNIGRFVRLLQGFKADTQFVVITHNPRTIEAADWIYGVTMEEPGVSSIVGVRLEGHTGAAGTAA